MLILMGVLNLFFGVVNIIRVNAGEGSAFTPTLAVLNLVIGAACLGAGLVTRD